MWLFDEDTDLTEKEILEFTNEGGDDAVRHFPKKVLGNPESMLVLVKNGYASIALRNCSKDLKKDIIFLSETAKILSYLYQDEFFSAIDKSLINNKALLDIFAAKADDPRVKQSGSEKDRLDKMLKSMQSGSKKVNRI